MTTYGRLPVAFSHGEGCWLFDTDGKKYFDALSGIAVVGLGHSHPAITAAITQQASQLIHCSNLYQIPLQTQLGDTLCNQANMDKVFFCNSGAEANEAAIKLARLHGKQKGISKPSIIVMEKAFHGRTMATLSATGSRKAQAGFEPLLAGFIRAPFNDEKTLKTIAETNNSIVAIMLEPIQGEGGIRIADEAYLRALRDLCDQNDWLLIFDEVQSGNGRTGNYFAYQGFDVLPDVVTTAKGLANGLPIGACLAKDKAASIFYPGSHGSTFGGNPLACSAALAMIRQIHRDRLMNRAKQLGDLIMNELRQSLEKADYICDIRGSGLMIGIEMNEPCPELVPLAQTQGLLINVTQENVIRLLPPLIMSDEEAEFLTAKLIRLIKLYAGDDRKKPR